MRITTLHWHILTKLFFYYKSIKDTTQVIKTYGFKGLLYNKQGDYLNAKKNLLSTVLLKRQHTTTNWYLVDLSNDVEVSRKYYRESLIDAKISLKGLENTGDTSMELRNAYHNVGLSYLKLDFPDSALILFKKSAIIADKIKADIFWNDLSRAYLSLGFYDSAIWCNTNAINNALDQGTRITLAISYSSLGKSYQLLGDNVKAIKAFKQALDLHSLMNQKEAQMEMMQNITESLLKDNQLNQALLYNDSTYILAQEINTRKGQVNALSTRFTLFKLIGDYKRALDIKQIHDVLLDSLQKGQIQLDLAKLDLYNDVELSKLKISDLTKQKELSEANLKNNSLMLLLVLIVVVFIILLLVFNYYRTQKLQKLNFELNAQQKVIASQNKELTTSNKEKELLLGEIHHRVKNNLQTISSLLSIQQRKLKDKESIKVLEDSKNRVTAMGLIHQHLYQNASFSEIDFESYTKELVRVLIRTNACCEIEVKSSIPPIEIDIDNAIFFGLIINELAINSIKHAYEGVKHPLLEISIFELNNQTILEVKDNGRKKDIDFEEPNSFGWKMVNTICNKLEGRIEVNNLDGLSVKLFFSKEIIAIKGLVKIAH